MYNAKRSRTIFVCAAQQFVYISKQTPRYFLLYEKTQRM